MQQIGLFERWKKGVDTIRIAIQARREKLESLYDGGSVSEDKV
jgi:hypothetical protein